MLQLRPNCECCDVDLPPDSTEARICSFECTFCASCAGTILQAKCPNCGGSWCRGRGVPKAHSRSIQPRASECSNRFVRCLQLHLRPESEAMPSRE